MAYSSPRLAKDDTNIFKTEIGLIPIIYDQMVSWDYSNPLLETDIWNVLLWWIAVENSYYICTYPAHIYQDYKHPIPRNKQNLQRIAPLIIITIWWFEWRREIIMGTANIPLIPTNSLCNLSSDYPAWGSREMSIADICRYGYVEFLLRQSHVVLKSSQSRMNKLQAERIFLVTFEPRYREVADSSAVQQSCVGNYIVAFISSGLTKEKKKRQRDTHIPSCSYSRTDSFLGAV